MMASMLTVLSSRRILPAILIFLVILQLNPSRIDYGHFRAYSITHELPPTLFRNGKSRSDTPTLDIVVSMYKENVAFLTGELRLLRNLPCFHGIDIRTIIYTKDADANLSSLSYATGAAMTIQLPNTGREGGTYLSHILLAWDDLARHTLFMQADPHNPTHARQRLRHNFNARTGVLPLGGLATCECRSCVDSWNPEAKFRRLAELYSALNGELCPEEIPVCYSGQVVVSAARIRQRKKEMYEHLKGVLESDMGHWIHKDEKVDVFKDEESNPFFGHTLERSYMVLWGCEDTAVVEKCTEWERLVEDGASLGEKAAGWCQCLDEQ
jgi:hypothetical protein